MSLDLEILGEPGRDNALLVRIDSGSRVDRILFDCGDGCVSTLDLAEIQKIDHLFFSHLHMDHVAGFDAFFRANYRRDTRANVIWGPPDTSRIVQHRLRAYWWNLSEGMNGSWRIRDIGDGRIESARFELSEAFDTRHDEPAAEIETRSQHVHSTKDYEVSSIALEHHGPCRGYLLREHPRLNVDTNRLAGLGLKPGPWLQVVKDEEADAESVDIDGRAHSLAALRSDLLVESRGESVAYLTDFALEGETQETVAAWLAGCDTLVCEAQYRHSDLALARRNAHTTTVLVAELARRAQVSELILFHLSDRYDESEWLEMLEEARAIFPAASFPTEWKLSFAASRRDV